MAQLSILETIKTPNGRVASFCVIFFVSMIGVSYAAVPLYQLFCQVTGYGGTTQVAEEASNLILDKTIKVRFDANTASDLPWDFVPVTREIELKIGEIQTVSYRATNPFNTDTHGRASFNVTPQAAGAYFNKMECFCFTDTTLAPGESMDMPVTFFIDPDIVDVEELDGVNAITLSYTFFSIADEKQQLSDARDMGKTPKKL